MPIRLMVVVVSCLLPAAAPFVAQSDGPPIKPRMGMDVVFAERNRVENLRRKQNAVPVRRQFTEPLALPIINDVAFAFFAVATWPERPHSPACMRTESLTEQDAYAIGTAGYERLADPRTVQRREVPSLSVNSRRLDLHLDTAGVSPWDSALVELWITRDGWTWQLYQNSCPCDALSVSLPWEGRYGLRVVVHRVDGRVSPTPRDGTLPQVWIDVNEWLGVGYYRFQDNSQWPMYCEVELFNTVHEIDQPTDVKQAKQRGLLHPCGYIKRVETERVVEPPPYRPVQQSFQQFNF